MVICYACYSRVAAGAVCVYSHGWRVVLLLWPLSKSKNALQCYMKHGAIFVSDRLTYLHCTAVAGDDCIPLKRAIVGS